MSRETKPNNKDVSLCEKQHKKRYPPAEKARLERNKLKDGISPNLKCRGRPYLFVFWGSPTATLAASGENLLGGHPGQSRAASLRGAEGSLPGELAGALGFLRWMPRSPYYVGQNQWYHFGVGAPPTLVYLVGIGMFTGTGFSPMAILQVHHTQTGSCLQGESLVFYLQYLGHPPYVYGYVVGSLDFLFCFSGWTFHWTHKRLNRLQRGQQQPSHINKCCFVL